MTATTNRISADNFLAGVSRTAGSQIRTAIGNRNRPTEYVS